MPPLGLPDPEASRSQDRSRSPPPFRADALGATGSHSALAPTGVPQLDPLGALNTAGALNTVGALGFLDPNVLAALIGAGGLQLGQPGLGGLSTLLAPQLSFGGIGGLGAALSPMDRQQRSIDVEAFILRHQVDDQAAQGLRQLSPESQLEIINSDLNNCRNPSAVLWRRIKTLQSNQRLHNQVAGVAPRVEEFILRYDLDKDAAQALKSLPATAQNSIIDQELVVCRNPSAVIWSRIRQWRAQQTIGQTNDPVEEYILRYGLDAKVASDLRSLPQALQSSVTECDLDNARNPSAVMASRIQAARQTLAASPES